MRSAEGASHWKDCIKRDGIRMSGPELPLAIAALGSLTADKALVNLKTLTMDIEQNEEKSGLNDT